ncbi:GNAT family N-acetyltransferase [Cuneatibacter sp. NSJ-177]|uniref:GNAT family N-acetyltransferase n=1 Tax=Cuneatibacter sp. NSJ-177 TaxID=2931401 RepID=UPI001FCFD3A8|nr:GNAT family N-acetyltransferase [Cuneatibacter sp. NSJ-177]MCJ7834967.1 GNAT family N-acetyltransferase [Cuneatibacter sp. NSJ-177]
MIVKMEDPGKAERLFKGWQEAMILSCLQGVMGAVYGDAPENPKSAAAILGDFCLFAGQPDPELVRFRPESSTKFRILVPGNEAWGRLIEACFGSSAKKIERYAIRKEAGGFSKEHLQAAADSLKTGYSMRIIDRELYEKCGENDWSRDLVSQFNSYARYRDLGLGMAVLKGDLLVSGASSYARYREGIEIEIDTREEYRGQGLAYACGAGLILECLKRGLYPSWDAHDRRSVALAEKLGYHLDHGYTAYEVWDL